MSASSKIEWTEATWNPVTGCTKISPGCAHCYAERMAKRLRAMGNPKYANGFQVTLHPETLEEPLRWRKPRMVFVCSMSDLFHEDVPDEFIGAVFDVMSVANQHTFQVLTKRAERMAEILTRPNWPLPPNVWVGVTAENQQYFDRRVPHLMRITRAAVRFVSAEPLLEGIWLPPWVKPGTPTCACLPSLQHNGGWPSMDPDAEVGGDLCPECGQRYTARSGIDWLIVGGESGPGAREMRLEWVRSLRDRASELGIPFFFKQWGGVNKKRAGRVLDGKTYNEMPSVRLTPVTKEEPCMSAHPKKCPFCGGERAVVEGNHYGKHWVRCEICSATGPWAKSVSSAINLWNMRAETRPIPAALVPTERRFT